MEATIDNCFLDIVETTVMNTWQVRNTIEKTTMQFKAFMYFYQATNGIIQRIYNS